MRYRQCYNSELGEITYPLEVWGLLDLQGSLPDEHHN